MSASAATYFYDSTVHVTARLGATDTNRTVSIYAQPAGGVRTLLRTGRVTASGTLTASYVAARSTTFTAAFSRDAKYEARIVTRSIGVHAKVSATISGYYASRKVGSESYRLYHPAARLAAAITVAPDKSGQCVALQAQEYLDNAWRAASVSDCGALNKSSKGSGYLTLTHAVLDRYYRVRADYVRSSKDTSNLSAASGWLSFIVEK
jgi:hypothetical protein